MAKKCRNMIASDCRIATGVFVVVSDVSNMT
jgi:hypothetical protein